MKNKINKRGLALGLVIVLLFAASLVAVFSKKQPSQALTAWLYLDGELYDTIDLSAVEEPYDFTVTAFSGGVNTVSVKQGSIGITSADCPDKICVSRGQVSDTLLPIVCLPHGLVIELRETKVAPDVISY